jgi:hypothetical protein
LRIDSTCAGRCMVAAWSGRELAEQSVLCGARRGLLRRLGAAIAEGLPGWQPCRSGCAPGAR